MRQCVSRDSCSHFSYDVEQKAKTKSNAHRTIHGVAMRLLRKIALAQRLQIFHRGTLENLLAQIQIGNRAPFASYLFECFSCA